MRNNILHPILLSLVCWALVAFVFIAISKIYDKEDYCSTNFTYNKDHICWMESGHFGSLDSYYRIVKWDPYNWDNNEYFTGDGFSKNKQEAMMVLRGDSCELKSIYFKWKEKQNENPL